MRSGTPSSPSGELLAGRYRVAATIGRGRSTVYRAEDTRLKRQVAVKEVRLFDGHEDHTRVRRRAMREAHATARLNNPHVVTVFDVVEAEESIWLVMELVDAPSLAQLVADQGALDHAQAARIALAMLDALEAAHAEGVVHRDVKPANVLVDSEGHTKLADFGVATIRDETRVTATGMVVGSPAYMSPEQARGEPVGPATDLWGLGATLYYAVEGAPPFEGSTALATASAVVHGEPRPAQRQGPLTSIIFRLLEKDPTRRPTAPQLRQALTRAAGGTRRRRRSWFLPRSASRTEPPGAGDAAPPPAAPAVGAPGSAASPPAPPTPATPATPATDRSPASDAPDASPESTAIQPTKPDQAPPEPPTSPPAAAAPAGPGPTAVRPTTTGKPPHEPTSPTPAAAEAEAGVNEAAASPMARQPAGTDEAEPTASAPPSTDLPSWLFDSAPESTPPDDEPAAQRPVPTPPPPTTQPEQPPASTSDIEAPTAAAAAAATAAHSEAEPAAPAPAAPAAESPATDHAEPAAPAPAAPAAESPATDHADTDQAAAEPAGEPDAAEPPASSTAEPVITEEPSATSATATSPDPDSGEPSAGTSAGLATGADSGEPSTNSTAEAIAVDEASATGTTATSSDPDLAVEPGAEPTDETAATEPAGAGDATAEPASDPLDPSSGAELPAAELTATDAQGSEPMTGGDTASAPSDVAVEAAEQVDAAESGDLDGPTAGGGTEALGDQAAPVEADSEPPDTTATTAASPTATQHASSEDEDVLREREQVGAAESADLDGPTAGGGTEALGDQAAPVEADSEPPDTTATAVSTPAATEHPSSEDEDAPRAAEQLGLGAAPSALASEPVTESASDLPATERATPIPATEAATAVPATERATTVPATEPATAVPATERASAAPAATERASALDDAAAADRAGERSSSLGGATSASGSRAAGPGGRWGALKPAERQGLLAAVVLVILLVVGLVAWRVGAGGDGDGAQAGRDGASEEETTSTAPSTTAAGPTDEEEGEGAGDAPEESSTTTTEATTATTQPATESRVPDGWVEYRHPEAGYTIAHPPGWQVVPAGGPRVDLEEPGTGTYLRIDWTAQPRPDPVADWRTQAQGFAGSHEAYQEIRIEPFRYRDYNAAIWEFTYRDGGVDLHAANLGFVAGSRGYALFFQTHADRWAASQELFDQFRASFRPAP